MLGVARRTLLHRIVSYPLRHAFSDTHLLTYGALVSLAPSSSLNLEISTSLLEMALCQTCDLFISGLIHKRESSRMVHRAGDLPALAEKCRLCYLIMSEGHVRNYELPGGIDISSALQATWIHNKELVTKFLTVSNTSLRAGVLELFTVHASDDKFFTCNLLLLATPGAYLPSIFVIVKWSH